MDREKLVALAERCEQATGPDRELDAAIESALDGLYSADVAKELYHDLCPDYTASIDAAKTLVLDGWMLMVSDADNGDALAMLSLRDNPEYLESGLVSVAAKTWPNAITAAALRALAHPETKEMVGD
ncbi:hypothetical protein [Sphingomonas sp. SRS2]|uniref:hypothetical protein n=1 Tax=Sphingomonas sp. SRS2 TaxID=133190 RepID=UPI00061845F3|nr:hypothetical protein [Sphingomonas sp. SRS2]KKC27326.1 hypothetical protein WP12_04050 [Sphingomonas sp. SRS2]